jgi:hypothetical protein
MRNINFLYLSIYGIVLGYTSEHGRPLSGPSLGSVVEGIVPGVRAIFFINDLKLVIAVNLVIEAYKSL